MINIKELVGSSVSIFLAVALQFSVLSAHAEGGGGTGGGGTHVCFKKDKYGNLIFGRDRKPILNTVELYDLYEAREVRRFSLVDTQGKSANELLNGAVEKIYNENPWYANYLLGFLKFYSKNKYVTQNKQYSVIRDANLVFLDEDCEYRELAQWRSAYESIFINGNLVDIFTGSQLNIAALALHEAVYALERSRKFDGNINSDHARLVVGQAFSTQKSVSLTNDINEPNPYQRVVNFPYHVLDKEMIITSSIKNKITIKLTPSVTQTKYHVAWVERVSSKDILLRNSDINDDHKMKSCIIDSKNPSCEIEVNRNTISSVFITVNSDLILLKEQKDSSYSQNTGQLDLKMTIDIFENNKLIKTSSDSLGCQKEGEYKINFKNDTNGISANTYDFNVRCFSSFSPTIFVAPYKEGLEQEVLGLDLKLLKQVNEQDKSKDKKPEEEKSNLNQNPQQQTHEI